MLFNIWLIASFAYSILLLRWLLRKPFPKTIEASERVSISFAVVFKNEEKHLLALLSNLKKQNIAEPIDLYFVNDHSTDASCVLIEQFLSPGIRHTLMLNEGHGKKEAIEMLMRRVHTDYLVLIDADVSFSEDFLATWIIQIKKHPVYDILQGQVQSASEKALLQTCMQTEQCMLNALTGLSITNNEAVLLSGANIAIRKAWFNAAQPYATNKQILSGDDLFLLEKGPSVGFNADEDSKVLISQPRFLEEYIHQRSRWASKTTRVKLPMLHALGWATFTNMSFRALALPVLICSLFIPVQRYYLIASALVLIAHHLIEFLIYRSFTTQKQYTLRLIPVSLFYPFLFLLVFTNSILRGNKYRKTFARIRR